MHYFEGEFTITKISESKFNIFIDGDLTLCDLGMMRSRLIEGGVKSVDVELALFDMHQVGDTAVFEALTGEYLGLEEELYPIGEIEPNFGQEMEIEPESGEE